MDEAAAEKSPHPAGGRRAAPLPPVYRFLLKRRCIVSRISKNVAEYFPHFAADSRTKSILESRFGNDGYAFWFKLLELLCKTDGHSYDCRNALDWEYLLGYTRVSAETAGQILDLLAGMGKIDQPLWADGQTIWCQALVENLRPVYEKRRRLPPEKPLLGRESPGRADYFPEKKPGKDFSPQAVPEKRQSRGKKSRGEKSKEESPCSPPAGDGGRFSSDGKGEKAGTQGEEVQEAQEALWTGGKAGMQGEEMQESQEVFRMSGKARTRGEGVQEAQEILHTGGKARTQDEEAQESQEILWAGRKAGTQDEGAQGAQEALRTSGKDGTRGEEVQESQEALWTNGKAETQDEGAQGAQEILWTSGKDGTRDEEVQESQEVLRTSGKAGTQGEGVQEAQEALRTGGKAGTKGEEVQEAQEVLRTGGKVGMQDEEVQEAQEVLRTGGKAGTQDEGAQEAQEVLRTSGKVGMQGKGVQEAFERFWTAYPRKVGKGRAEKLFVWLKPDHRLLDTMLTAIEQAKGSEQWQRDQGRYIPNPSTWLGQRRWEDEPFPDSPTYCGNLDPPDHAPPCALPPELAREKERREEALRRFRAGECGWEELMPE